MRYAATLLVLAAATALPAHGATCQAVVTDLPFGAYRYNSAVDVDTAGTVSVECTDDGGDPAVGYTITIDTGQSGNFIPRVMAGDGELHYNVYVDGARTRVWGDGSGGSESVTGGFTLPTPSASHPVFARIPAFQTGMGAGAYADQLTVLVSY